MVINTHKIWRDKYLETVIYQEWKGDTPSFIRIKNPNIGLKKKRLSKTITIIYPCTKIYLKVTSLINIEIIQDSSSKNITKIITLVIVLIRTTITIYTSTNLTAKFLLY